MAYDYKDATTVDQLIDAPLTDMHRVQEIQIQVSASGKVWINVDGKCIFRALSADSIRTVDERRK